MAASLLSRLELASDPTLWSSVGVVDGATVHYLATPLRYRWMGITPTLPVALGRLPRPDVVHVFGQLLVSFLDVGGFGLLDLLRLLGAARCALLTAVVASHQGTSCCVIPGGNTVPTVPLGTDERDHERMDLDSVASTDVMPGPHNTLAGIDGLYWHRGSLIAIQNGIGSPRIAAFRLSKDGSRVTQTTVLENRTAFTVTPTTGAIHGNDFYFIANSQSDNLNGDKIMDVTKLSPVRIAMVRLP